MQIEGCRVDGWTASDGAIVLGHPGPVTMFDCAFENPPGRAPPVVLASSKNTAQTIIVSSNAVPPGNALLQAGPRALVTEIPAGKRKPVLPRPGQGFLCRSGSYPRQGIRRQGRFRREGRREDRRHAGDPTRDRRGAAARQDAIAYLPAEITCISRTLEGRRRAATMSAASAWPRDCCGRGRRAAWRSTSILRKT